MVLLSILGGVPVVEEDWET